MKCTRRIIWLPHTIKYPGRCVSFSMSVWSTQRSKKMNFRLFSFVSFSIACPEGNHIEWNRRNDKYELFNEHQNHHDAAPNRSVHLLILNIAFCTTILRRELQNNYADDWPQISKQTMEWIVIKMARSSRQFSPLCHCALLLGIRAFSERINIAMHGWRRKKRENQRQKNEIQ